MYLLVILGVMVVFVLVEGAWLGFPTGWGIMLLDFPSLLLLLLITIPVLLASGLGKDFVNAFRLFFGKKGKGGLTERKKAVEALNVFMKALRYGGIFVVLLQFVGLSNITEEFDVLVWLLNMAVMIIPLLYAYVLNLLLLPIRSRLNKEIIDYMKDTDEEEAKK